MSEYFGYYSHPVGPAGRGPVGRAGRGPDRPGSGAGRRVIGPAHETMQEIRDRLSEGEDNDGEQLAAEGPEDPPEPGEAPGPDAG